MKRVLVFLNENDLTPKGGPLGYCYNLKNGLSQIDSETIKVEFLKGGKTQRKVNDSISEISNKSIKQYLTTIKSIVNKSQWLLRNNSGKKFHFEDYDAIHFHQTIDLYRMRGALENYKGKVLLTMHTPTKPSFEIFDRLSEFERKHMMWLFKKFDTVDDYAVNRTDYLILPCPEAEEPYYNRWNGYAELHKANEAKYRYIVTGTAEKKALARRGDIRKQFNIPENAFVCSFVGRHNKIKGYEDLKAIAKEIFKMYDNVYFLIAGKEGPCFGLDNKHWIEVGWTNDPGSVISAADVFILPNQETYFDLIFLEVLSLGQLVIASNTGGNKYYKRYKNESIELYTDVNDAVKKIEKMVALSEESRRELRKKNRQIFEEYFNEKTFAYNYVEVLKEILC